MIDFEAPKKSRDPSAIVVVLNYNGWEDTLECLSSLEKLQYPNFEVIVVDNKSTDDSYEKIKRWISDKESGFPKFTLLASPANLGYAGGNNIGIRRALEREADYVWILNNDTVVDPDSLSELAAFAQANPRVGLLGSTIYNYDKPREIQALGGGHTRMIFGISGHRVDAKKPLSYISGASLFARTQTIREIGLLDERYFLYWEDTDFSFRTKKAGWAIAYVPASRVWHKEGKTPGERGALNDFHHTRSGLIFLKKHCGWRSFFPITVMVCGKLSNRLLRRDFSGLKMVIRALSKDRAGSSRAGQSCYN